MLKKAVAGAALCFTLGLSLSPAESRAENRRLSITEAVETALRENHEIRAFGHSLSARKEEVGISRSLLLPTISFEERFMRTDNPVYVFMGKLSQERFTSADMNSLNNPAPLNDFQTTLSFEQPIYARKAYIGLEISKKELGAKEAELSRKKEEIAFRVIRTSLMIQTSRERLKAAEKGLEDAKEHLRIAELRSSTGLGLQSDFLRASTALTEAEQRLVSSRKDLDLSFRALGLLLGMDSSVDITDGISEPELKELEVYTREALSRPDLKALELRNEEAKGSIKMAEAGYFPTLGVGGAYQLNNHSTPFGSEGTSWQLTAFLRWNLFDGTKSEHDRAKAKFQAAESEEQFAGMKKSVSFRVYEAYLGVQEAKKNADLARSGLQTSEEGRRLVRVRYENSLSPIVDLLDAQLTLDNSRAGLVARENDYRLSVLNLEYESGTLLKGLGIEK
ncbi:MAG: TolC family protein [Nitrospirales bacterium]|nr:TolC family protein [Nitrospirales bacterium]